MKFNNKHLRQTSNIIHYAIAVILCGFLILLSGILLNDVGQWREAPGIQQFQDMDQQTRLRSKIHRIKRKIETWDEKKNSVQRAISSAEKNHSKAKQSFENWLKTRETLGSPNEDQEVIDRARELDDYFKTQQDWELELSSIDDSLRVLNHQKNRVKELLRRDNRIAREKQVSAIRKNNLNNFLIRLLIILPILLLGVWFILRFRNHKYWPLFLGFVLFSFYAFFFGLVPYLPEYGGYIRYSVGIILVVLLGIYAINKIRKFVEQKKQELQVSSEERSKKVLVETAEKALEKHLCPSCGKDYMVKGWDKTLKEDNKTQSYVLISNFCRFCGLELFKKCKSCGTENYAHLPYCCGCGDTLSEEKEHHDCSSGS